MKQLSDVRTFFRDFIRLEQRIEETLRKRSLFEHNRLVKELLSLCHAGLAPASEANEPFSPVTEMIIESNKAIPVTLRLLYKIAEYDNAAYTKVWLCYTSAADPIDSEVLLLTECFAVAETGGEPKIVARYSPDEATKRWQFAGGDKSLEDYYSLGTPAEVKRILSPAGDKWSIEEYTKNS